jgi:hypothetical protein
VKEPGLVRHAVGAVLANTLSQTNQLSASQSRVEDVRESVAEGHRKHSSVHRLLQFSQEARPQKAIGWGRKAHVGLAVKEAGRARSRNDFMVTFSSH